MLKPSKIILFALINVEVVSKFITNLLCIGAFGSNEHVPISVKVYSRHRDQNGEKRHKDRNQENREMERSDRIAPGGKDESVCNISQFPSKDEILVKPINELDLSNCERCTPSYRLLPKDVCHFFLNLLKAL